MSNSDSPAIIGVGQTALSSSSGHLSLQDLIFEAARAALADAAITQEELHAVVIGAQDVMDGRGISNMQNAAPAGAYMKEEIRVAGDGLYGLILAALQQRAKRAELTLVVSWSKPSETSMPAVTRAEFEPFYQRPLPLNETIALGIQASAIGLAIPDARQGATETIVRDRLNGARNERAHLREPVAPELVENSPVVCWPLRALDLTPATDGACALVLASGSAVRRAKRPPVYIRGYGWASDPYSIGDRSLQESHSLRIAAERAYRMAGLTEPPTASVVELVARSSYQELIMLSELGLCPRNHVVDFLRSGATRLDGALPINPSGGVRSSCPPVAAGLFSAIEVARQLSERAGAHQVRGAQVGIAHGSYGQCLQSNSVVVLGAS